MVDGSLRVDGAAASGAMAVLADADAVGGIEKACREVFEIMPGR